MTVPHEPTAHDLASAVGSGLRWSAAAQLASRVLSVGSGVVLFRVLQPGDFGLYAFAFAVLTVLLTLNDLGIDVALIRRDDDDTTAAGAAAALVAISSVALFVACLLLSPVVATLANAPEATNVLRLLSCVVLIDGVVAAPRAELLRSFGQRRIAAGDLGAAVITAMVGSALAVAGLGVWAPTIATVLGASVNGAMILLFAPSRPMPHWNTAAARRLVAVGLPISGTAALELALLNADTFIIAELLGTEQLAFYALAFNVSSWPATIVSQAVRKVSIGAFASIAGNDARVATTVATGLRLLVGLVLPLAAGIAVVAPSLLGLIYGPKSAAAVPLLRWLAVLGGVRVLTSFLFDALVSTRHQRFVLGGQTVWFVAGVAAVWWGAHRHGTVGVAAAHAVVALLVAAPLTFAGLRRLGADNRQLGTTLLRYALAAAVATAAGVLGVWLSPNAPAAVAIGGLALLGVYCLGLVATGERSLLTEFSRGPKPQRR